jgi:hypothetical protein
MKIKKRNMLNAKKLWFALATLALVILASAGYLYLANQHSGESLRIGSEAIDYNTPSDDQMAEGRDIKKNTIDKDQSNNGPSPDTNTALKVAITTLDVDADTLYIRSEITGIFTEGTCTLTMKQGGESLSRNTGIQPLPQSSTCKGFNIPMDELSKGEWTVVLDVSIGESSGTASGIITI